MNISIQGNLSLNHYTLEPETGKKRKRVSFAEDKFDPVVSDFFAHHPHLQPENRPKAFRTYALNEYSTLVNGPRGLSSSEIRIDLLRELLLSDERKVIKEFVLKKGLDHIEQNPIKRYLFGFFDLTTDLPSEKAIEYLMRHCTKVLNIYKEKDVTIFGGEEIVGSDVLVEKIIEMPHVELMGIYFEHLEKCSKEIH